MKHAVAAWFLATLTLGATIGWSAPAFADAPTALAAADVARLLDATRGPRVIALWSLECVYCEDNLRALLRLHHAHPRIEVVLVSTDPIERATEIAQRLVSIGATDVPAFAYADALPQRINALIDPDWGGELPRTVLLMPGAGQRKSWSGALQSSTLRQIVRLTAAR